MNTQPIKWMPKYSFVAILITFGLTCCAYHIAWGAEVSSGPAIAPTSEASSLEWRFQIGEVFRVEEQTVTTLTDKSERRYRNEVRLVAIWQVEDVAPDGSATLIVMPERIGIHFELPVADFDTALDDPTVEPFDDPALRSQFFEARAWSWAKFRCWVTAEGEVRGLWGAIPTGEALTPIGFTPAMFSRLPENTVHLGETWKIDVGRDGEGALDGQAAYRIVTPEQRTGDLVYHIEGTAPPAERRSSLGGPCEFGPMIAVYHFNATDGYFVDQITATSGHAMIGPDEHVTVLVGTKRKLTLLTELPDAQSTSGTYVFARSGKSFRPLPQADIGVRMQTHEPLTTQDELRITFYRGWDDTNRDLIPAVAELREITTSFPEGEPIEALVTMPGVGDEQVVVLLLDSQGQKLATVELPMAQGPTPYAQLQQDNLPGGIYFFEWHVNGQYLVRVPVRVFGNPRVTPTEAAELTTIETMLPVHVNIVVKGDAASIYANQSVIDTVPAGTVLRASKVRDEWWFVERARKSGWIHAADVILTADAPDQPATIRR